MPLFDPARDVQLGPRSWGKRPSTAGIIFHTTEYASPSRASAAQCASDQSKRTAVGGWAQPGSYNFIVYDGGALLTVPYLEGSGGINPQSTAWQPEAWLKMMLPPAAFADPTMHHLQVAFSGKAAELAAGHYPGTMIDLAARIVLWVERSTWGADNQVISGHLHWQDNRSDPGHGVIDRILAAYDVLRAAPPPATVTAAEQLTAITAQRDQLRKRVRVLAGRLDAAEARITAGLSALEAP